MMPKIGQMVPEIVALRAGLVRGCSIGFSRSTVGSSGADYSYADLADLALAAPAVVVVTVHDAIRLKGADAAGVAPVRVRLYIDGDVGALIAGRNGLPGANLLAGRSADDAARIGYRS